MIPESIQQFLQLIRHGKNSNTYKLAWAKAIVEISLENPKRVNISLEEIARKMFKYYWDQSIFFDLIQSNNPNKRAEFVSEVKEQIEAYFQIIGSRQPIKYLRIKDQIEVNTVKLVRILKQDVSWRFLKINQEEIPVYTYLPEENKIELSFMPELAAYSDVLFESMNFKWTQVLEGFNNVPRIARKVKIIDMPEIKRNSLSRFKPFLNLGNPQHICFHCGKRIADGQLSIDHIIPWSFIYNDDIWNLVYAHKSCNSSKSNTLVKEEQVKRLEKRNKKLKEILEKQFFSSKKIYFELVLAIENDLVRKFWIGYK